MSWAVHSAWMWLLMVTGTVGFWVLVALAARAIIAGGRPDEAPPTDAPLPHRKP